MNANVATWDDETFALQVEADATEWDKPRARRIAQTKRATVRKAQATQLQARREDRPVLARAA